MKRLFALVLGLAGLVSDVHADDREELRQLQAVANETHRKLVAEGKMPRNNEDTDSWVKAGESGYVNCLLTILAEGTAESVTVVRTQPLPDLSALASGNKDLKRWASSLAFRYNELSSDEVISLLTETLAIQESRRGKLKTILVK